MTITKQELAQIVAAVKAELEDPVVNPAAIGGFFQVVPGETILSDHMNTSLINGVPKFANAAARDAQWPSPPTGAICYLTDLNYLQIYDSGITGGANYWRILGTLRQGYARMGNSQSIPNDTDTLVKLDLAAGAANMPGRSVWNADGSVTLPVTGTYLVSGNVVWPANTTGDRRCFIQRYTGGAWVYNGCAGGTAEVSAVGGSGLLRQSVSSLVAGAAGEKVGMRVRHNAGTALVLPPSDDQARLAVVLIGQD